MAPLGIAGLLATAGAGIVHAQDYIYEADRNVTVIQADHEVINHFDTVSRTFTCPNDSVLATFTSDGALWRNQSSGGVNATQWSGSEGANSLTLTFTNWNVSGDQTTGLAYICTGNQDPQAQTPAPTPTPAPQPQQPTVQVGLNQSSFQAAFNALLQTLAPAARISQWNLGSYPNSTTNAGHLVQLYAQPQKLNWMDTQTLTGVCPQGGSVVQDPSNYLAVPYVPRVSATNVFSTLVDGGIGSGSISVSFNNGVQGAEIASFEYTCRVPGPVPADATQLATLTQRRSHW
jgi:hypothetical protein